MDAANTIRIGLRYLLDAVEFTLLAAAVLIILFNVIPFARAFWRRREINRATQGRTPKWRR